MKKKQYRYCSKVKSNGVCANILEKFEEHYDLFQFPCIFPGFFKYLFSPPGSGSTALVICVSYQHHILVLFSPAPGVSLNIIVFFILLIAPLGAGGFDDGVSADLSHLAHHPQDQPRPLRAGQYWTMNPWSSAKKCKHIKTLRDHVHVLKNDKSPLIVLRNRFRYL